MSLYLTETDRRRLVAAQEAMVSPLAYEDRKAWMLGVNNRIRELTGAEHTIAFFLDEGGFEYVSDDTDEGLRRLELLVPAYEAGVRAWRRMQGYLEMLDAVHQALAVLGPDGAVLFRSRALERLFRREPMSSTVVGAMEKLAQRVGRRGRRPAGKGETRELVNRAEVTTPRCGYTLWASPVRPNVFGTDGVLVQVERRGGALPPREDVQDRFELTPREAEVALLLAEGLDNRRVAERLSISPHTARRHTEAVMKRLGISSRAAVAVTLLRQL